MLNHPPTRLTSLGLALFGVLTWPLAWLPASWGLVLGGAVGGLLFRLMGRRRRVAMANIELIKSNGFLPPDTDAEAISRGVFVNLSRSTLESLKFYHRGYEPFRQSCLAEAGEEYLKKAVADHKASGRGLMFITGHSGNWEIGCHYMTENEDIGMAIVGRETGVALVDGILSRLRRRCGHTTIGKSGGARAMLAVLKKGGVLGTLIDQAAIVGGEGVPVPFMGREAMTNLGPIKLMRHTNSLLVPVFFRREGRRILATFYPALELPEGLSGPEAELAGARRLNDLLGEYVRRYPDQWMWSHRRWKTPRGVAGNPDSIT